MNKVCIVLAAIVFTLALASVYCNSADGQTVEQPKKIIRVIHLQYTDPAVIAQLFGGTVIRPYYGRQGYGYGVRGNGSGFGRRGFSSRHSRWEN